MGAVKPDLWAIVWSCLRNPIFSRFGRTPTGDRRTDGKTHGHSVYCASVASGSKKVIKQFVTIVELHVHFASG